MRKSNIIDKLLFLYNKEYIEQRVTMSVLPTDMDQYTVELHELKCKEAHKLVSHIIILNNSTCALRLIHGYNRGTAIKEMLWSDIRRDYNIENMYTEPGNPGVTIMLLNKVC